jgi:hypothetical protein
MTEQMFFYLMPYVAFIFSMTIIYLALVASRSALKHATETLKLCGKVLDLAKLDSDQTQPD